MAYRDNTKSLTPTLKACKPGGSYGVSSTLKGAARPGRQNKVPAGADSVASANGKTPRPGGRGERKAQGGGTGSVARPGFAEGLNRGVNAK